MSTRMGVVSARSYVHISPWFQVACLILPGCTGGKMA